MVFKKKNEALGGNYKLRAIKVFGSKENLFHNVKKYRRVYDELESRYIYCELSFFNKLFDEQEWETEVRLVCTNVKTGKQLCDLKKPIHVQQDKNIIYVREGWGTPEPGWWKSGKYKWTVYIDDENIGETTFYIVNGGLVTEFENPYFTIDGIKLFESPRTGTSLEDRVYCHTFKHDEARYINVELSITSFMTHEDFFPLELQFNFYNDAGQHKAYMDYLKEITDRSEKLLLDTGYGSQGADYWYKDRYTLEVLFMDQLVAVIPFEVGDEYIEQEGEFDYTTTHGRKTVSKPVENSKPTFEQAFEELDALIGLGAVKDQLKEFSTYLQFLKIRKSKGFDENQQFSLHSVFMGNPGTGKTTVANMLGKIYHSLDLLSHGKVHEVGRADLVGEFIGQTAPKVKKAIDKARGGILFIDEAYALTNRGDDKKDFGKEVIEVLIKEMSDGPGDIAIVAAGYPKEMQNFLSSNPGMTSRFRNIVHFPDYTPNELMDIAEFTANNKEINIEEEAKEFLYKKLVESYRNRDENFGNARYVNGIIEEAKQNMALRLMKEKSVHKLSKSDLSTISEKDVRKVFGRSNKEMVRLPVDEGLLNDAITQLHELVGLENIKKDVDEIIKLVRYYREIGKNVRKSFSLHTVFKGNPGTGKTTIARLLVQIYKALGILERGHLVECDRKDLVAGYVGQTAIKTGEVIDKAIGGGLFIDEAYSLSAGGAQDFGREAIETLLKRMEDHRGEFMVIAAGYPDEMNRFIEMNPGLMSRFDKNFTFDDYDEDQLMEIANMMFEKEGLHMDNEAEQHLRLYVANLVSHKHKYFGNARTVRKVVQQAIRKQNLRMAETDPSIRSEKMIETITVDDVQEFNLMEEENKPRGIGFR